VTKLFYIKRDEGGKNLILNHEELVKE